MSMRMYIMKSNNIFQQIKLTKEIFTQDLCSIEVYVAELASTDFLLIKFKKGYDIGTIGIKESEKIIKSFDYATKNKYPIITYVLSGGIKIQEGFSAAVQIINIISAINNHNKQGLLYVAIVRRPTFGGTSIAMVALADIIIFEDDAIFGFAGKKIIEKTYNKDFQEVRTSKFWDKCGFADIITNRENMVNILIQILQLHINGNEEQKL